MLGCIPVQPNALVLDLPGVQVVHSQTGASIARNTEGCIALAVNGVEAVVGHADCATKVIGSNP